MVGKRIIKGQLPLVGILTGLLWICLTACGADTSPEVMLLAPTSTETMAMHSVMPSASPTFAPLPTITLAPTRAETLPTTVSVLPLQPTFTPAPATQTATFQPALAGIQIEYFITSAVDPSSGDSLTLFWRVSGAEETRIFRLNDDDRRTEVWDVLSEGRLTVGTTPEEEPIQARFLLQATARGSTAENTLVVEFSSCGLDWFFQPAPDSCPTEAALFTGQVEQHFENGFMVWLGSRQEIYVFYNDDNDPTWQAFPDTFTAGQPESDDTLLPPPDRQQPVRGFGLIWRENQTVQTRLGWAIESEAGYDGVIQQTTGDNPTTYLRIREGGILAFDNEQWELIPFTPAPITDLTPEATEAAE